MGFWEAILAALGGMKLGVLISAILGGFVSLNFFEGPKDEDGKVLPLPTGKKWTVASSGTIIGIYGSGPLADWLALEVPTMSMKALERAEVAIGLFLALFGMSLVAALIKAIPAFIEDVRLRIRGGTK